MQIPCPYCKGTKKFRHERPANVSDRWWFSMTGQAGRCALCKGAGVLDRPMDSLVLDTGLIFIKTLEGRVMVGCPDGSCNKWVDATDAFTGKASSHVGLDVVPQPKVASVPVRSFTGKCSNGHDITIDITPTGGKF